MDPISQAIGYLESHEAGEQSSYHQVAKKFGVDRTTLSRGHQGVTQSDAAMAESQQLLTPQQELELVLYIGEFTTRGSPPTREIVQNFASAVAKQEVSESWVTRFLHRHSDQLTTKWSAGLDCQRHEADSKERYES
jgi:hypothetical protein